MAYERYGTRDHARDDRWRDERFEGRGRGEREDRGFFERAGDEVASWFGDEEAERRRREDQRMSERERGYRPDWRSEERGGFSGAGREWDRGTHEREEDRQRASSWTGRDYNHEPDRGHWPTSRERGGYRPLAGDYGRGSDQFF